MLRNQSWNERINVWRDNWTCLYLTDKELSGTVDGWDPAPKAWEIRRHLSKQNVSVQERLMSMYVKYWFYCMHGNSMDGFVAFAKTNFEK